MQACFCPYAGDHSRVIWEEFFHPQVNTNKTYPEAKSQFSDRNRYVVINVYFPHKWWSTLKSAVFWHEFVIASAR